MQIIITNAGLAAIVNGEATGTAAVQITKIGLGSGRYTPSKTLTALQAEFKQIDVIEGGDTGDNSIHVAIRDDSEDSYAVYEFGLYLADGTLFAVTSQQSVILQKVSTSQALLSVDIKFDGIDTASITFEGMTYSFAAATTENAGICELATEAETLAGTDSQRAARCDAVGFGKASGDGYAIRLDQNGHSRRSKDRYGCGKGGHASGFEGCGGCASCERRCGRRWFVHDSVPDTEVGSGH